MQGVARITNLSPGLRKSETDGRHDRLKNDHVHISGQSATNNRMLFVRRRHREE